METVVSLVSVLTGFCCLTKKTTIIVIKTTKRTLKMILNIRREIPCEPFLRGCLLVLPALAYDGVACLGRWAFFLPNNECFFFSSPGLGVS